MLVDWVGVKLDGVDAVVAAVAVDDDAGEFVETVLDRRVWNPD